jgi:HAE1 family hydrophobic/amphiphilic exporter-1
MSFGLTVVYATLFSLVFSFTLTPMLCGLLLKKNNGQPKKKNIFSRLLHPLVAGTHWLVEFMKKEYRVIFDLMFRFPKTTLILVVALFFGLRLIMPYIGNEFMPSDDEDKIIINVVMSQGSTIERTGAVIERIEKRLEQIPEKKSVLARIGDNGAENASITLDLVSSKQRKRSDMDIVNELIPFMAVVPDAEISMVRSGLGGGESDVTINVFGLDYAAIVALSGKMKAIMEQSGYFRSVSSSYKTPKQEIQFIPDQKELIHYGVSGAAVGSVIRASVYGDDTNIYKEQGEEYDINVELNDAYAEEFADIQGIAVISRQGLVPITRLGMLKYSKALPTIWHRDKERVIQLSGDLSKGTLGDVTEILDKEFAALSFEEGYRYAYSGDFEHQAESQQEIGRAFLLAVILTYMLLAAIMNSGLYPVAIMMTVVTSFIGVFLALFFSGDSINVLSLMGIVMLVGLVVNNAILMLDYTLRKMSEGVPVKEALWLGASVKFRAILMTSLAIVLGVVPQMSALMAGKRAMGSVMIGGMLASIVFTFVFVPVVFWYIERFRAKRLSSRRSAA